MDDQRDLQMDPLQNVFADVDKIIAFMELKDLEQARAYEREEEDGNVEMWLAAQAQNDTYLTYFAYWNLAMFQQVQPNVRLVDASYWMKHPMEVPVQFRDVLQTQGRANFLSQYVEKNDYYRMLSGLPPYEEPKEAFIYLSDELRERLHASKDPVHLLPALIQNQYMDMEEYQNVLKQHPDKTYLKYLGMYKIDLLTARNAFDFEIIRYPSDRADINPTLLERFFTLYGDYREYVMSTLYNRSLEQLYPNYRNFMGFLILSFTLLQLPNVVLEASHSRTYMDDTILHTALSMYDIPSTLILPTDVRRTLAASLLRLTQEKGTDDIYYDLIKILGYQDVVISKLLLMKGQQFDEHGNALDAYTPYFLQIDLNDPNPYDTIVSGNAPRHGYESIIAGDPQWCDLPDTRKILEESAYTMADTKYILLEAKIHQMEYIFESIYFMRMILDHRTTTDAFYVQLPELFGTDVVSIYDLMVFVLAASCIHQGLRGQIRSDTEELLSIAGFNFNLNLEAFQTYLDGCKYVEKERVLWFLNQLNVQTLPDIHRVFCDTILPMREWLEGKIASATERNAYIEYESIYRALFTYDIQHDSFLEDFQMPMEILQNELNITDAELRLYQHFYPRTISGQAIKWDEYGASRYPIAFGTKGHPIPWYIHVLVDTPRGEDDRGYVYFHDILNGTDLRTLENPDGSRVFMDYIDGEVGWEINQKAVQNALEQLEALDEDGLKNARIQIRTPILNSGGLYYELGTPLPQNIRSGVYKELLIQKLKLDMEGYAEPPETYLEYLYRKNLKLYHLLTDNNRHERDPNGWLEDVLRVLTVVETNLGMHLKYFEQSVVGNNTFFRPLITLIKHFKSSMVDFAKAELKFIFDDKMDVGGNSNMFKLFDDVRFIIHFVTLAHRGYSSQFGLFDAMHHLHHNISLLDRLETFQQTHGDGFDAIDEEKRMGSIHMHDEMKFFKNGTELDPDGTPSHWVSGEPEPIYDEVVVKRSRSPKLPVDLDGWKDFVESHNPET